MSATARKSVEIISPSPMPVQKIDEYSYALGFSKGYTAGDSSPACWAFGVCAILVIIGCLTMLYAHLSRLSDRLSDKLSRPCSLEKNKEKGTLFSLLLPLALIIGLAGCAGKQGEAPAPVPPDVVNAPAPADSADKDTGKFVPHDAAYQEDGSGQYLAVRVPDDPASGPRDGEPAELAELLEMKGADGQEQTAV